MKQEVSDVLKPYGLKFKKSRYRGEQKDRKVIFWSFLLLPT